MGDVSKEREELKKAYPKSTTWSERINKMSEAQVIAVYSRLKAMRKLGK